MLQEWKIVQRFIFWTLLTKVWLRREGGRSADKKLKIEHPIIFKILYNGNDDKNGRQDDGVDDSKDIDDDNNDDDDDDDNAMMKYGFALG